MDQDFCFRIVCKKCGSEDTELNVYYEDGCNQCKITCNDCDNVDFVFES